MNAPAMTGEELHIASLVVYTAPSRAQAAREFIVALPGAQVHAATEGGKLIVTLEAAGSAEMTSTISTIQHFDGVLSTALVYQCADSLEAMNTEMNDAET